MAKNELIVQTFDYELVSKDEAGKLQCLAREIARGRQKAADAIIETGESLAAAQDVLSHHRSGTFQKWVDAECVFSVSTAYRYMDAYREFGNCATVGQIELSAMYVLAKNGTAKNKALKLLSKGIAVTQSLAKKLVKEVKDALSGSGDDEPEPDPAEEEFPEDETLEEMCERETSEIESWARQIAKLMKEAQKALEDVPTLDELNARTGWERKLTEALATLRATKPRVCPMCEGHGDKKCPCKGHGRVTRQQYNQMV